MKKHTTKNTCRIVSLLLTMTMLVALFPQFAKTVQAAPLADIDTKGYVTYKDFGAVGDGVTDDYKAIVATHEYANSKGLPVKADAGATYYIGHMDPSNKKGALIKTDTDWGDATFIIDDAAMTVSSDGSSPEGLCYLFTVEPSKRYERKWINPTLWWRWNDAKKKWDYITNGNQQSGDIKIYLGLDPNLSSYKEYDGTGASNDPATAYTLTNKTFSSNTTQFSGSFSEKALYVLKTDDTKRWNRSGSATASAPAVSQQEIVIVNKDGSIDSTTPLQWDWDQICEIYKYVIDDTVLTVSGGTFITKVNILNSKSYIYRGINIVRSNVVVDGVKHYLEGEEAQYTSTSYDASTGISYPRLGAPYQGFFRLDHCAYVTLKNCVLADHLRVYMYGDNVTSTAPYDYYAEFAAAITLDHCTCSDDIMDDTRWGTTGTNYCKSITVQNGCAINRIDAHKGTYNLTIKDSTIGVKGIAAVGFGDMIIENSTIRSNYFVHLRRDFGSAWYGDIKIKDCVWDIGTRYVPELIFCSYNPLTDYAYEPFTENGTTYYCQLPNVEIDGLTIDASNLDTSSANSVFNNRGLQIFSNPFPVSSVTQSYLNDRTKYKYPLKAPEYATVKNLTVVKNPDFADKKMTEPHIRNSAYAGDAYFFESQNVQFTWDGKITETAAKMVTVTFDANGGSGSMDATKINSGYPYFLPSCAFTAPAGMEFAGWDKGAVGASVTLTADTVLKAQWRQAGSTVEYTVTISDDGNGIASASATSCVAGTEVTLYATPNNGYQFKEWQVISGGVTITDNKFVMGSENVAIKAIFEVVPVNPDPSDPKPVVPDPVPVDPSNPNPVDPDPSKPAPVDPQPGTPDPKNPDPVKEPSFEDFIERLYNVALDRKSDTSGKEFWMNKVLNEGFTGADCARGFLIESPEFGNRGLNDDQFLEAMYATFFDREPDKDGLAFWKDKIKGGMSREKIIEGFIDSTEWCNLCATYGVKSGAPNAKAEKASTNAIKFATRLYTECLGREPDEDGLTFWALRLTNLESTGYEAARDFFESKEFTNKKVSDDDYIKLLYRTFMGRDADADGFKFWKDHLSKDMTRLQVLQGFAQSQEFTNICNEYGIVRGNI